MSTALNEYTDPRELFRFVIRFFIRGILYVCLFYNVFEHRIGAIIFEQINLFDVECYVTFPTSVKKPWNLYKMKLRRKEKIRRKC